jgi:DNA (cytosine-5)-methyltransferase 1
MAGFRVLWASEFVEAARDSYNANKADYTILDGRDIRDVTADDVLSELRMLPGELDLFDGSPPCASFSMAGKREEGWGKVKKYSDTEQRTDDLFFEFARLVAGIQPKVFIAENVKGLVIGKAKEVLGSAQLDIFLGQETTIYHTLCNAGYQVAFRVLNAADLGVPQARNRVIFCGVRKDLVKKYGVEPSFPKPLGYQYSVRDALPWIVRVTEGVGKNIKPNKPGNSFPRNLDRPVDGPRGTVTAQLGQLNGTPSEVEAYVDGATGGVVPLETDIARFAVGAEWDKIQPGEQSEKYFSLVKPALDSVCPTITASSGVLSLAGVVHPTEKRKFTIPELRRICGFPDDFKLTGTYAQQWERLGRAVPPVMMSHIAATVRDEILARCK